VEAAGDLAQLIQHAGCPGDGAVELRVELAELGWYRRLCCAQVQRQRDQPLLGAVVQVSPDTSAGLVGGGDDPRARRGELGPAFRVGDGGRDELGEPGQPLLGVLGSRSRRNPTPIAPQTRPSTTIGLATAERIPSEVISGGLADGSSPSRRAARPVT
jgi:hypothetical protein